MLKKELLDTFRSTRAKIVFFVFLAIMVYDFVDKIYWQYQDYWFHPKRILTDWQKLNIFL